jgi:deoxyadenosine/deoxycytidine kinase
MQSPVEQVYWDDESPPSQSLGRYIAISGNTGSGKSTLLANVTAEVWKFRKKVIGINERILHHPILKLMFRFPTEYSFFVQSNFALQRAVMLYRWLSLGYTVIIERSHLDDPLFVDHHFKQGHMTQEEYECYYHFSKTIIQKIPDPDIYVFLDASPALSMSRLAKSEKSGERPEEFPTEIVKLEFVEAWHTAFQDHFRKLTDEQSRGARFRSTTFMRFEAEKQSEEIARHIVESFLKLGTE